MGDWRFIYLLVYRNANRPCEERSNLSHEQLSVSILENATKNQACLNFTTQAASFLAVTGNLSSSISYLFTLTI